jgi:hypothetical protein
MKTTISVFICSTPEKETIMEKLKMFYGGKYTATKNVWVLNVNALNSSAALNAIEYCLAGHNTHIETCEKTIIITLN